MAFDSLTLVGNFDAVVGDHAFGWAYEPGRPETRLAIEILRDDELVGYGIANQHRSDLGTAGIGDGNHAFKLHLSDELMDGTTHRLKARVARRGFILAGGPHDYVSTKTNTSLSMPRKAGLEILVNELGEKNLADLPNTKKKYADAYILASLLQETYQLEEAELAWEAISKSLGKSSAISCKRAETQFLRGNLALAQEQLEQARQAGLNSPWLDLLAAQIWASQKNYQAAVRSLIKAERLSNAADTLQRTSDVCQRIIEECPIENLELPPVILMHHLSAECSLGPSNGEKQFGPPAVVKRLDGVMEESMRRFSKEKALLDIELVRLEVQFELQSDETSGISASNNYSVRHGL